MSTATTTAATTPDTLDLYRYRDDIAQTYNPATAHERMLVTLIAQCWLRLQRACEYEQRYLQNRDVFEVITTKLHEFKAVTRYVTDCDRSLRHATLALERAQRRRQCGHTPAPAVRPSSVSRPAPPAALVPLVRPAATHAAPAAQLQRE